MDVTNSEDKKNIFAGLNDVALFSDDELALLNNSVYSLEPFDSAEIDGILNSYNYGSTQEANTADFPPSWNATEIENTSNDFLNDGIDYGNLLSSCIDNASGPINPANDLLSLELLQEQPYELILPYEPEPEHQPKTEPNNVIEFDWDELMVHSPKSNEPNAPASERKCAVDNNLMFKSSSDELGALHQSLITKFESLKYDEVHQYDFSIEDTDAATTAAAATAADLPGMKDNLRQYHVFLMPLGSDTNHTASMQSLRDKLHRSPLVIGSLIGQSIDADKQSKLIIPFKPKLVEFPNEQKSCDDANAVRIEPENASKTKRNRKHPIKLTEALKTRNEIHDILEALKSVAETHQIEDEIDALERAEPSAKNARAPNERKLQKEKITSKLKKSQDQKVTNFRCSERIQQRRRKTRVQTLTKRHETERVCASYPAKSNQRSTESNC